MTSTTKRAIRTTMLASAICLSAFRVNAEHVTFNLPMKAHWGATVLQPGRYTFEIPLASSWPEQISLTKNGSSVLITPLWESVTDESNRSYLRLVTVGDAYFVREYNSGLSGKQFTFPVPKKAPHELMVQTPEKDVPVGGTPGS